MRMNWILGGAAKQEAQPNTATYSREDSTSRVPWFESQIRHVRKLPVTLGLSQVLQFPLPLTTSFHDLLDTI